MVGRGVVCWVFLGMLAWVLRLQEICAESRQLLKDPRFEIHSRDWTEGWFVDGEKNVEMGKGEVRIRCQRKATSMMQFVPFEKEVPTSVVISIAWSLENPENVTFAGMKVLVDGEQMHELDLLKEDTLWLNLSQETSNLLVSLACQKNDIAEESYLAVRSVELVGSDFQSLQTRKPRHDGTGPEKLVGEVSLGKVCEGGEKITLVSHASSDRLEFLIASLTSWTEKQQDCSQASVAILLMDNRNVILKKLKKSLPLVLSLEIAFFEEKQPYPINFLRNEALQRAKTDLVLIVDGDIVFGGDFSNISNLLHKNSQTFLAIPCFEEAKGSGTSCLRVARQKFKRGLLNLFLRGKLRPFKSIGQPKAQGNLDFQAWANEKAETHEVSHHEELPLQFEPFLVVRKSSLPRERMFDERFSGFGWNKVSMVAELRMAGFRTKFHADSWLVHCAHEKSSSSMNFTFNLDTRMKNRFKLFLWLQDVTKKHQTQPETCPL